MRRRTLLLPLALLLVLAAALAACGDDGGEDGAATTTAPDEAPSTTVAGDDADADSAVGPPTTRGPAPTVTIEPPSTGGISVLSGEPAYTGVLGRLTPDQAIVAPVALPPAPAAAGIAPLTGLPVDDTTVLDRPAVLAKIDNSDRGRPQEAVSRADLVYEEMIEGGATRLAAVFHTEAPLLGPVRSGRTTDISLIGSLNEPIFAWSGANRVHAALLRQQVMVDLGAQTRSEYFRADDRPGTYDLMIEAGVLHDIAAGQQEGGAPPPHFEYRNDVVGLPAEAEPATRVDVTFPMVDVTWEWDAAAGGWARTQDGTPHVDADDEPVVAANVVVAEVEQVPTGSVDTSGSTVYEQLFVGAGRGWVLTDGHVVEVTWTKPSIGSVATWTTPDGVPVPLTPGITWVELAPPGAATVS